MKQRGKERKQTETLQTGVWSQMNKKTDLKDRSVKRDGRKEGGTYKEPINSHNETESESKQGPLK